MKRLVRYPQKITERWEIEWNIDIYPKVEIINSSTSVIDIESPEYENFIDSMITEFTLAGFELYRDSRYTHPSNTEGSQSDYYTFLQIRDYVIVEVIVHVRISDHPMKRKKWGNSATERRQNYLTKVATEFKDEYELETDPVTIPVDIVFRDENEAVSQYVDSYIAAMFKVRKEIKAIKQQIAELQDE